MASNLFAHHMYLFHPSSFYCEQRRFVTPRDGTVYDNPPRRQTLECTKRLCCAERWFSGSEQWWGDVIIIVVIMARRASCVRCVGLLSTVFSDVQFTSSGAATLHRQDALQTTAPRALVQPSYNTLTVIAL